MAEHYGVKPKMFTKEWWQYFWMYYKWHTISILFVVMLIAVGISECSKIVDPDLGIVYFGSAHYDDAAWAEVNGALAEDMQDINNDDEVNISCMHLPFLDDEEFAQENYVSTVKYIASFSEKTNYIYICDKDELERNALKDIDNMPYYTTDLWLDVDMEEGKLYRAEDGKAYAVSLKDSKLLKDAGIYCEGLYLLMKNDTTYNNEQAYKNAMTAINKLLK